MKTMFRRVLSIVLTLSMVIGMLNLQVLAVGGSSESGAPLTKTADGLDADDRTNVTLTVPGELEGNIDVVFVLGGGMTANMETIESAINVFKPAMESGKATVRMGLISLEKGKEIILDLNSDEAVLDPDTYVEFVTEKFDSINDLPGGTTNLHSQLLEARKMLAEETKADPENKYVFVLATGRTYWFDDANGEQATIVNKVNGTYYWANYLWQSQRGRHSSLYMLPDRYNDSYEAFFADIEAWVAADGDTYVFTPHFDVNDYSAYANWYAKNNKDLRALGLAGSRFGLGIVDPVPTAENFITGVPAAIGSETHPLHALNYERAQYECVQVWKDLVAAGYNCYSICSENPNYQNGSEYIKLGAGYTGTSTTQVGHSFMNYLATLAGQDYAPTVWDYERDAEGNFVSANPVLQENFFDAVRDDMLYTTSVDSTVEDFIGKNENGNFEFIENADCIKLNVAGVDYVTAMTEDTDEGSKYTFIAPDATEPTFWLDYYYGDGETTERFVWTFGENVSMERLASLTYKLQLTEKQEEAGEYTVPTNNSATLYPVDSDGEEGTPQIFPVPFVNYTNYTLTVHHVDTKGESLADDEISFKAKDTAYSTSAKEIVDYTFKETTGDAVSGTMDGDKEVTYVYGKNYTLKVNYVDESGSELDDSIQEILAEGSAYTTEQKTFEGYTFQKTEGNAVSGTMDGNKEVTYVYSLNRYTLTVNWVDEDGNVLSEQKVTTDLAHGDAYTTEQKAFAGYTFQKTEGDATSGTMDGDKEVTYVYSLNRYTLTVNWVDEDGNVLAEQEVTTDLAYGADYTTEQKVITGYTFKETEGDAVNGIMDSDKEVTYVYTRDPVYFRLITNWVDEDGNALVDPTAEAKLENELYTTEQKTFAGYTFKETEGDAVSGTMDSDKEVTYVYSLNHYTLTVNWVDEDGNVLAEQEVTTDLAYGTDYTTEQKDFADYTFKATEGDAANGTMDSDKEVTYIYSKNPVYYNLTVKHVDESGNELAATETSRKQEGTAYSTSAKEIAGYTFKTTEGDAANGTMDSDKEVTYIYSKNTVYYTLTVKHVDESGNELAATETSRKQEGADYSTSAKEIAGYTFQETEGDAVNGTMDSDKEVTYVYSKDLVYYTLIVHHVDESGKKLANTEGERKLAGADYSTSAKAISGYTFKTTEGDAANGTMDSDKEVTYIYSKNAPTPPPVVVKYKVTYEYVGEVPAGAPTVPGMERYKAKEMVIVEDEPTLEGYIFSGWSTDDASVSGGEFQMPRHSVTFVGSWTEIPPVEYTLTVKYVDEDGNELDDTIKETLSEGDTYATEQKTIEGYTFEAVTGDAADGSMDSDKVVVYVYSKIEIPVEPEEPEEEEPTIDIFDEDIPLADVPKTGDTLILWIASAMTSVLGLAWLASSQKKRRALEED